MILESPFDHFNSVAENLANMFKVGWIPYSTSLTHKSCEFIFKNYNMNGLQPIDMVSKIYNKKLPILIICSKEDKLIPWQSTVRLYEKFIPEGFINCHLLITDHGNHANILWGKSGQKYYEKVHSFYKDNNLPYCKQNN